MLPDPIRPIRPEDAVPCWQIVRDCLEQDISISGELRRELLARESPASMIERARRFYVEVFEGAEGIVGIGGIDLNEIRILCVAPALQGRGIGRQLLRHLEGMVPPALFREIFVYASPGAVGFYRSAGYGARGEHVFPIAGHGLNTIFMVKRLEGS
jgi:GNAT superfamily N-acetyltransferase